MITYLLTKLPWPRDSEALPTPGQRNWGSINKFWGGHKNYNILNSRVWTKNQRCSLRNSTTSGVKTKKIVFNTNARISTKYVVNTKKKVFISTNCASFNEFWGETTRKKGLYCKILEKTVVATSSGVITSILGVSSL